MLSNVDARLRISATALTQFFALSPTRKALVQAVIVELLKKCDMGWCHNRFENPFLADLPGAEECMIYMKYGITILYFVDRTKIHIDCIDTNMTPPNGGGRPPRSAITADYMLWNEIAASANILVKKAVPRSYPDLRVPITMNAVSSNMEYTWSNPSTLVGAEDNAFIEEDCAVCYIEFGTSPRNVRKSADQPHHLQIQGKTDDERIGTFAVENIDYACSNVASVTGDAFVAHRRLSPVLWA